MSDYNPGILENSAKMVLLFHLIEESVRKGDKLLVFRYETRQRKSTMCMYLSFIKSDIVRQCLIFLCSQSLSTLTVIEDFLIKRPVPPSPQKDKPNQNWVRNLNYYRKLSSANYHMCFYTQKSCMLEEILYMYADLRISLQELLCTTSILSYIILSPSGVST